MTARPLTVHHVRTRISVNDIHHVEETHFLDGLNVASYSRHPRIAQVELVHRANALYAEALNGAKIPGDLVPLASTDILGELADLHHQATTERSHYYVAQVVRKAMAEIETLRARLGTAELQRYRG